MSRTKMGFLNITVAMIKKWTFSGDHVTEDHLTDYNLLYRQKGAEARNYTIANILINLGYGC